MVDQLSGQPKIICFDAGGMPLARKVSRQIAQLPVLQFGDGHLGQADIFIMPDPATI